ncbi:MAG: hypothetical protein AVDCRST_MAG50-3141, partial [uncultured Acidimicrobiales bacterium]
DPGVAPGTPGTDGGRLRSRRGHRAPRAVADRGGPALPAPRDDRTRLPAVWSHPSHHPAPARQHLRSPRLQRAVCRAAPGPLRGRAGLAGPWPLALRDPRQVVPGRGHRRRRGVHDRAEPAVGTVLVPGHV